MESSQPRFIYFVQKPAKEAPPPGRSLSSSAIPGRNLRQILYVRFCALKRTAQVGNTCRRAGSRRAQTQMDLTRPCLGMFLTRASRWQFSP